MTAQKKRVLVTGGARGMGEAIVRRLATNGYDVHFTYARSAERAQAIVRELSVEASLCDLSRRDDVESFAVALENAGPYYAFVHNAGITYDSLAATIEQVEAERLMQVNFWSFARIVRALMRPMTHARAGRIIAIGSVTAERGSQGNAVYAASKSALKGFVTTLAIETARRGVTVNLIAPGYIDTDMMAPYAAKRADIEKQIPAQRFGKPEEIAAAAAFLLSDEASYISGATLVIDGGLSSAIAVQR